MLTDNKSPVVLCILDGWGIGPSSSHNAIYNAQPKHFLDLLNHYPSSSLHTSGKAVGLPDGQMGNSEVGHMTIGSGRVIEQDLVQINKLIQTKEFFQNTHLTELVSKFKNSNKTCHLIGLASDGGIHSHIDHTIAISEFLENHNINTNIHIITDGRDTLPQSAIEYVKYLNKLVSKSKYLSISSISGRYYAMDRDARYERTEKAYNAIVRAHNSNFTNPEHAITKSYSNGVNDEFILPQTATQYSGMKDGDAVIFTNFRADRMRQIVSSISANNFNQPESTTPNLDSILTMTSYSAELESKVKILVPQQKIENTLAEVLSKNNLSQLHIAETEKYAHVTFFFNAGKEHNLKGEDRLLIKSPKVATYDLKPEMSAYEMTDTLLSGIENNSYDFIVVNYANADMVGHTGNYKATVNAIQHLDTCIGLLSKSILKKNGTLLITADHGNAEMMFDPTKDSPYTSHTKNPVPFIVVHSELRDRDMKIPDGTLADIAPTVLGLLNISSPKEMTGKNLISQIYAE